MRHGCSILTATISRSFIRAKLIFIVLNGNRIGVPEDIAAMVAFLFSDNAAYINGQTILVVAAQSGSLLAAPDDPTLFRHPFAGAYYQRILGDGAVRRAVGVAQRCPPNAPFAGPPFLAFVAHRRLPGNQGDPFIVHHAAVHDAQSRQIARDSDRCPARRSV